MLRKHFEANKVVADEKKVGQGRKNFYHFVVCKLQIPIYLNPGISPWWKLLWVTFRHCLGRVIMAITVNVLLRWDFDTRFIRLCSCCLVKTLPDTKLLLSSMCWLWLACCLLGQVPRIRKYYSISTFIKFTFNTIIQTNDFKAEYCFTNKVNLVKIMHLWIVTEQYYKPIIGWIRRTLFCIDTAISWSNR